MISTPSTQEYTKPLGLMITPILRSTYYSSKETGAEGIHLCTITGDHWDKRQADEGRLPVD
jgi:hypothetical protein